MVYCYHIGGTERRKERKVWDLPVKMLTEIAADAAPANRKKSVPYVKCAETVFADAIPIAISFTRLSALGVLQVSIKIEDVFERRGCAGRGKCKKNN